MIFTERQITVHKGKSSIDEPVILYRGDFEVSIKFTIMKSKFRFKSGVNLVDSEKASYGQLAILAPYGGNVFSEVVKCEDGTVTFTLTKEMIDQLEEVGLYSFQIRLFDYYRESRVSIPPVEFGIEVREPVASEDHDNSVNNAIVGYSIAKVVDGLNEDVGDTFDAKGQYNKTNWNTGDRISQGKLNKIEDALDKINQNEIADVAALDKRITSNFNVLTGEINSKADDREVVKKGEATLNDFDEQSRATILGMSSGEINAVLGADNVTEYNIADNAIMPEHCKFLPNVMTDVYMPHLSVPGGLGGNIGDDGNVEGYYRTDYIYIGDSSEILIEEPSGKLSVNGTVNLFAFLYMEKGGTGVDVNTGATVEKEGFGYRIYNTNNYAYMRLIDVSLTKGDFRDTLRIYAIGKRNTGILAKYDLDERYASKDAVPEITVVPVYRDIYDGSVIRGGFNDNGTRADVNDFAGSDYLPILDGTIADGTRIDIWVDGYFNEISSFIFVYTHNDGRAGYRVNDLIEFDEATGVTSFIVPKGGYRYLALMVVSPTYGDYHEGLVIQTIEPDGLESQVTINGYNLDDRYALKNEVEDIIQETLGDMDLSGGGGGTNKLPRPSSGVVNFVVQLNTNLTHEGNTLSIIDNEVTMPDNAVLLLPTSYSASGTPTRLVINCHGAGTTVTASTSSLTEPVGWLVNGLGYAVLDVNGVPKSLSSNTGLHYGSPLALQSYLKAYQYVIENYNIKSDGCFVMGTSMGGLTSFMLVQSGSIPVLAQAGMCPVTDHYKQAYCQPWVSGINQRSQIAKLFGFTGTEPTWTSNSMPSDEEKQYYLNNLDKVIGYNPMMKNVINWNTINPYSYDRGDADEAKAYAQLVKFHPVPLKIWHNDDDGTVAQRYSSYLVQAIRNAGGLAYLRKFPSGGHNAWNNGDAISAKTIDGEAYSINVSAYEVGLWFKRFDK